MPNTDTSLGWLPGDATPQQLPVREQLVRAIRVDHAGEYGAVVIAQGAVDGYRQRRLRTTDEVRALNGILAAERRHLTEFQGLRSRLGVRPSLLLPLWKAIGYATGYISGRAGMPYAMAVTHAVEDNIAAHYTEQLEEFAGVRDSAELPPEFLPTIERTLEEEIEHRDTAIKHGSTRPALSGLIYRGVSIGVRAAIKVAKSI